MDLGLTDATTTPLGNTHTTGAGINVDGGTDLT